MTIRHGSEDALQAVCVDWFRHQYTKEIIYAVPNGARRNIALGAKLKRTGMLAGVPDLCIPCARGKWHGLYIEMKVKRNYPTPAQREIIAHLMSRDYRVEVCRSFDEFKATVDNYMIQ